MMGSPEEERQVRGGKERRVAEVWSKSDQK